MARIPELEHLKIPLEDVKQATNNFSDDNCIGKGGFGKVYTGQLLHSTTPGEPISTTVAVKRLDKNISGQGSNEFLMEIMMLASYKHENLVTLVGFSDESDEKIIVYEEEVHGSLDKYIASSDLTWEKRLLICLGAARGLDYLHSGAGAGHRVLHRDIKSSNILLNANWEAKISDFGLSKIGPRDQEFTFLVTHACGTLGYADPQYLDTGVFSKESDVYSFGVVLFEVLCGRFAMKSEYHDVRRFLYNLAKLHYKEERLDEIIMTSLKEHMKSHALHTFSAIAYKCLNDDRKQRPTMRSVVQELQYSLEFQMGCRNMTQLWGSSTGGASWSWQFDSNQKLKRITIDHEDWIYSIGFTCEDSDGSSISSQQYGGTGGSSNGQFSEINFDADEEIVEILGTVGVTTGYYAGYIVISSLTFVTNKKRDGPFGKEDGTPFSVTKSLGTLAGFYGRAGYYMDGLGFYLNVGA